MTKPDDDRVHITPVGTEYTDQSASDLEDRTATSNRSDAEVPRMDPRNGDPFDTTKGGSSGPVNPVGPGDTPPLGDATTRNVEPERDGIRHKDTLREGELATNNPDPLDL